VIFRPTAVEGAWVVEVERREDDRGFFARTFCAEEFAARGLVTTFVQCGISFSHRRGTLRGLHVQRDPHGEAKLVRCTRGAIYDVVVDLRRGSRTYGKWHAIESSAKDARMLYLPPGCAHGVETLEDATEVAYQMSVSHHPESATGIRWDDPALGIPWPVKDPILSDADRRLPTMAAFRP
jgi:dTDP-4-dehydrorhamnose 3,5-epimerase